MTPSPSRSKVPKALVQHSFERPGVVDVGSGSGFVPPWPVGFWAQVDIDMTWVTVTKTTGSALEVEIGCWGATVDVGQRSEGFLFFDSLYEILTSWIGKIRNRNRSKEQFHLDSFIQVSHKSTDSTFGIKHVLYTIVCIVCFFPKRFLGWKTSNEDI